MKVIRLTRFTSIIFLCIISYILGSRLGLPKFISLSQHSTEMNTSSLNCAQPPLHYNLAQGKDASSGDRTKPMEFSSDLNGNGTNEIVKFYHDDAPTNDMGFVDRYLPVVLKVYQNDIGCLKELYTYTADQGERNGNNELLKAEVFNNFWGDGKNAVMFIAFSTAYGSGYEATMRFLIYDSWRYRVIDGPKLNELTTYSLLDKNILGKLILISQGKWDIGNEPHFESHIQHLSIWEWNGEKYIVNELGTTKNKYSQNIDEIIQGETTLLKKYISNPYD